MAIILIRSIILYIIIISSVRLMGKRQLGELQPSELVITILVSNVATLTIEDTGTPLIIGITPILALVSYEVIMSYLMLKFPGFRCKVSGRPKIIISDGKIDRNVMRTLRFSVDDLFTALRLGGIFSLDEVQYAVVETTGNISFMKKSELENVTRKDMEIAVDTGNPQQIVIADGKLINSALSEIGRDNTWLEKTLKAENCTVRDVFILTADSSGAYYIVKEED